jgi:hypothetical protein
MELYAVEVVEPEIERGELIPWWSVGYAIGVCSG